MMVKKAPVAAAALLCGVYGQSVLGETPADGAFYREACRPQFHFTSRQNWLNDPNGCVFHDGEYHLFFQHNPKATVWGNMTWGHAVSPDLVHWKQLDHAIHPYGDGTIFSGSAVVDAKNTSGLGKPGAPAMVALFTHAGKPFAQAAAYSIDKGRSWMLLDDGKHVIANQGLDEGERDPKVFWYAPTGKWVMVLWVKQGMVRFFTSDNLKQWSHASDFSAPGLFECPDLVELPVQGEPGNERKWVLYDASFHYWVGSFDGKMFKAEAGPLQGDAGRNFYAAQTWNHTPNRVIQIAWMRDGKYPDMPFNQQMSFPCELSLRTTSQGIRLCRKPVDEIESLRQTTFTLASKELKPGENPLSAVEGELFDIEMQIEPGTSSEFGIRVGDQVTSWSKGTLSTLGQCAPLAMSQGELKLRLLADRTSLEVFGNDGELSMSSCFVPEKGKPAKLELYTLGGNARLDSLTVHTLRSAWEPVKAKATPSPALVSK